MIRSFVVACAFLVVGAVAAAKGASWGALANGVASGVWLSLALQEYMTRRRRG